MGKDWTDELHEIAKHDTAQGESMSLPHQRRALAEIERLKTELKAANERADKAEGKLHHYEGPGRAYAD